MFVYYVTRCNSRWVQAIEPGYEFQMPSATRKAIFITRIWLHGWRLKCRAGLEVKPPELSALIGDDTKLCRYCNRGSNRAVLRTMGEKVSFQTAIKLPSGQRLACIASPCWLISSFVCEEQTSLQCPLKSLWRCVRAEEPFAAWQLWAWMPTAACQAVHHTEGAFTLPVPYGWTSKWQQKRWADERLQGQYRESDSFTHSCPFGTLEHPGCRNLPQDHW